MESVTTIFMDTEKIRKVLALGGEPHESRSGGAYSDNNNDKGRVQIIINRPSRERVTYARLYLPLSGRTAPPHGTDKHTQPAFITEKQGICSRSQASYWSISMQSELLSSWKT